MEFLPLHYDFEVLALPEGAEMKQEMESQGAWSVVTVRATGATPEIQSDSWRFGFLHDGSARYIVIVCNARHKTNTDGPGGQ